MENSEVFCYQESIDRASSYNKTKAEGWTYTHNCNAYHIRIKLVLTVKQRLTFEAKVALSDYE